MMKIIEVHTSLIYRYLITKTVHDDNIYQQQTTTTTLMADMAGSDRIEFIRIDLKWP